VYRTSMTFNIYQYLNCNKTTLSIREKQRKNSDRFLFSVNDDFWCIFPKTRKNKYIFKEILWQVSIYSIQSYQNSRTVWYSCISSCSPSLIQLKTSVHQQLNPAENYFFNRCDWKSGTHHNCIDFTGAWYDITLAFTAVLIQWDKL